jgi:hypothetical protein
VPFSRENVREVCGNGVGRHLNLTNDVRWTARIAISIEWEALPR